MKLSEKFRELIHSFQCRYSLSGVEVIQLLREEAQRRAQHKKEVEDLKKQISTLRSKSRVRLAPGELR